MIHRVLRVPAARTTLKSGTRGFHEACSSWSSSLEEAALELGPEGANTRRAGGKGEDDWFFRVRGSVDRVQKTRVLAQSCVECESWPNHVASLLHKGLETSLPGVIRGLNDMHT